METLSFIYGIYIMSFVIDICKDLSTHKNSSASITLYNLSAA